MFVTLPAKDTARQRLAEWFLQWRTPLVRHLAARARLSPADVDDLAQEVSLRMLRYERTDLVAHPQAYLFKIAANVLAEWSTRASWRKPHAQEWLAQLTDERDPAQECAREDEQLEGDMPEDDVEDEDDELADDAEQDEDAADGEEAAPRPKPKRKRKRKKTTPIERPVRDPRQREVHEVTLKWHEKARGAIGGVGVALIIVALAVISSKGEMTTRARVCGILGIIGIGFWFVTGLMGETQTTAVAGDAGGGYKRFLAADPHGAEALRGRFELVPPAGARHILGAGEGVHWQSQDAGWCSAQIGGGGAMVWCALP